MGAFQSSVNHHFWVGRAPYSVINVFIYRTHTYVKVLGCFRVALDRATCGNGSAGRETYSEMTPLEMFWRSKSNRTMLLQCQSLTLLPQSLLATSVKIAFLFLTWSPCGGSSKVKKEVYDTRRSQAVPHPSTTLARRCLTSVIGRERVYSSWYGRRRWCVRICATYNSSKAQAIHRTS